MSNKFEFNTFDELLNLYKDKIISQRQFITYSKSKFKDIIFSKTQFLDSYNADILERLFCIVNGISTTNKCKYCDNKAIWSGRFNEGYLEICNSANCRSKQLSDKHAKTNEISVKRDSQFILAQSHIKEVNDDIIINLIKYDKYLELINNQLILDYLDTRYSDSYSRLETLQRIRMHVEEKPTCPICGNPVKFIGRKRAMFSIYCCDKCSANSKLTISKRKSTLLEKWGSENCYDSEQYKQQMKEKYGVEYHWQREDIKEKRKNTLIEKYNTDVLYKIPGVKEKVSETCLNRYGYDSIFKSPEIREKGYEKQRQTNVAMTSKAEEKIYNYLVELGYKVDKHVSYKQGSRYISDFYLIDYDLYIEYQGSQFHHGSAYFGNEDDLLEIKHLKQKSKELENKNEGNKYNQYDRMLHTWTELDVEKRNFLNEHHINCLEIFDCPNKEALNQQLTLYFKCKNKESKFLTETQMDIFINDLIERRKIIQNIMKQFNKKEFEITDIDIAKFLNKNYN